MFSRRHFLQTGAIAVGAPLFAQARPMPLEAPVIRTDRPLSSRSISYSTSHSAHHICFGAGDTFVSHPATIIAKPTTISPT